MRALFAVVLMAAGVARADFSRQELDTFSNEPGLSDFPASVLAEADLEKSPAETSTASTEKIDRYIANLPKNKRWMLRLVDAIAAWYQVDSKFVLSIISVESNFSTIAQLNKQAQGVE